MGRLHVVVFVAVTQIALNGCRTLKEDVIAKTGPTYKGIVNECGENWTAAQSCAEYVMSSYAGREQKVSGAATVFGALNLAAGTLAAVYAKSATDRSQALEDLGVTVATLSGIRSLARIEERRQINIEAREAVSCVLKAARAVVEKAEVNTKQVAPLDIVARYTIAPKVRLQSYTTAQQAFMADVPTPDATQTAVITLLNDRVNSVQFARIRTGNIALSQAGSDCTSGATTKECRAAIVLAENIAAIVREANSATFKPAEGIEKLHETQRKLVDEQIGALRKAVEQEQTEENKLEGSFSVVQSSDTTTQFGLMVLADKPKPETNTAILQTYANCVAPQPAPTP